MIISMFFCMLIVFFVAGNIVNNVKRDRLYNEIKYHSDYIAISRNNKVYIGNQSMSKYRFISIRLNRLVVS